MRGWLLGLTYTVSGEGMIAATKAAVDAGVDLTAMDPIDVIRAGPLCMAEGARLKDAFVYPETMPYWFTDADRRFLHRRIRALRVRRAAELLPQHRQRLARPGRPGRQTAHPTGAVHRRPVRRRHHLGSRGRRTRRRGHAGLLRHPHGRRRRALDSAGSTRGDQPAAARFPWRAALIMLRADDHRRRGRSCAGRSAVFRPGSIAVCATVDGVPVGMAASSFTSRFAGSAAGVGLYAELLDHLAAVAWAAELGSERAGREATTKPVPACRARPVTGSPAWHGPSCPAGEWSSTERPHG